MLETWGPGALGVVFGYLLFFFVTLYKKFDAKSFGATIAAIGTGAIIKLITLGSDQAISSKAVFAYCFGVGIGFASFAIYFLILSFLYMTERITGKYFRFLLRSQDPEESDNEEFDHLLSMAKDWADKKISDDDFKNTVRNLDLSRTQLINRIAKARNSKTKLEQDAMKVLEDTHVAEVVTNIGKKKIDKLRLDSARQFRNSDGRFASRVKQEPDPS